MAIISAKQLNAVAMSNLAMASVAKALQLIAVKPYNTIAAMWRNNEWHQ
jgi:hypothetical protein